MKKLICIAVLAVLIAGCQTVDDFIGEGPIKLSSAVTYLYQNKYLKGVGPEFYVITADGRDASYAYCAAGTGECQFDVVVLDAVAACEKRTGQKCYIFAEGDKIVWKGAVSFGEVPSAVGKALNLSNAGLCEQALDRRAKGAVWSTLPEHKVHVAVAKSRKLIPEDCKSE